MATAGCIGLAGAPLSLDSWTPDPGTWPLPEYDPEHTAHNPHANPPTSAVVNPDTWELDVESRHLLVANGFVIGAGLDGIRMVRPPEHGRWWNDDVGASAVGVHDGTLYAATPAGEDETGTHRGLLRGIELDTWAEVSLWTTFETGARNATQLLPTAGAAFVGYPSYADDRVPAFDPDSGDRVGGLEGYMVSVANGTAYANRFGIVSYRPKTGILADGFREVWETPPTANWRIKGGPTVIDGQVLRGDSVGNRDEVPVVRAVDAVSGERQWTTRIPSLAETTWTGSAAADSLAFVAGSAYRRSGRVVAVDLAGDGVRWAVDLDHWYESIAVAGGLVLVAGGVWRRGQPRAEGGQVTALDAETGKRCWSFRTDAPVAGVVPVEDVVYVATQSGIVHALRAA
jgi:outer membrane protein assembly factor BamB